MRQAKQTMKKEAGLTKKTDRREHDETRVTHQKNFSASTGTSAPHNTPELSSTATQKLNQSEVSHQIGTEKKSTNDNNTKKGVLPSTAKSTSDDEGRVRTKKKTEDGGAADHLKKKDKNNRASSAEPSPVVARKRKEPEPTVSRTIAPLGICPIFIYKSYCNYNIIITKFIITI